MIAPKNGTFLPANIYDSTFLIKSESMVDESVFEGKFEESKRNRSLQEHSELVIIGFTPRVDVHSPLNIEINLRFHNTESMSIGGNAFLNLQVKEPTIFKSSTTLRTINLSSFK